MVVDTDPVSFGEGWFGISNRGGKTTNVPKSIIVTNEAELKVPTDKFDFKNPQIDPVALSEKLVEVMYAYNGIGLAANQIGIGLSVIALRGFPEDLVMFNPKIVFAVPTEELMEEGCLSFPGLVVKIKRSKEVRVRFQAPNGEFFTRLFSGLTARTIQHEIDHLEGKLFWMRANKFHRDQAFRKQGKIK